MKHGSLATLLLIVGLTAACKTVEEGATSPTLGVENESTPPAKPQILHSKINCSKWSNASIEAFAFEASEADSVATLLTKIAMVTQAGQIPAGTYKMVDGSPIDGSCMEYYADISTTIKGKDSEKSGLIVSNCDVSEEFEWNIKAYVRRTDGQGAEVVYDERYNCAEK